MFATYREEGRWGDIYIMRPFLVGELTGLETIEADVLVLERTFPVKHDWQGNTLVGLVRCSDSDMVKVSAVNQEHTRDVVG